MKTKGTRNSYGIVGVKIKNCYSIKDELLAAMHENFQKMIAAFCEEIKTVNNFVAFIYDNTVSCAEEYTDWNARTLQELPLLRKFPYSDKIYTKHKKRKRGTALFSYLFHIYCFQTNFKNLITHLFLRTQKQLSGGFSPEPPNNFETTNQNHLYS